MPSQSGKSPLFAKYGGKLDAAVKKHAADPTEYGMAQRLPPGITNGVAEVFQCGFKTYKSDTKMKMANGKTAVGEYYLDCRAVMLEPASVMIDGNEVKVEGLHTTLQIGGIGPPVFDTKTNAGKITSQEEWVSAILNEFRKLGAETTNATGADLESLAAAIEEIKPRTKVSTSQSKATPEYPNPRVWENWNGNKGLEEYVPPDGTAVEDNSGGTATTDEEEPSADDGATSGDGGDDIAALIEVADGTGDGEDIDEARRKLTESAKEAGVSEEDIQSADSWASVVELMTAALEAANEPPPAEEEPEKPWEPEKGEVYKHGHIIIDPKTKKPVVDPKTKKPKKGIDVEVTAVDKKTKTVTLLNVADKKTTYKGVKWDAIVRE